MTFAHILAFNAALIFAILSPGPAMLMSVQTSLTAGRRSGILLGLGLATVAALWTAVALLGLDAIFTLIPSLYIAAKVIGALYLLYIAWGMWRGADTPLAGTEEVVVSGFFWRGALVNFLNPKSVLFAAAVLVTIFPSGMSFAESALIVANHWVVEVVFYTGFAVVMSVEPVQRRYLAAKRYIDRAAAAVLGALGLRLLLSR